MTTPPCDDAVVLVIDPTKLTARLVYEPPAPLPSDAPKTNAPGELYPHCYGPINASAIVDVMELRHFEKHIALPPPTVRIGG